MASRCQCGSSALHQLTHKGPVCSSCENAVRERILATKRTCRGLLSEEERLEQLLKSKRRVLAAARDRPLEDVINAVNSLTEQLPVVTERIFDHCTKALSHSATKELVCCVCDCRHPSSHVYTENLAASAQLLAAMSSRLKPPPDLPCSLQKLYDMSAVSPALKGMLLGPEGVVVSADRVCLQLCLSCRGSLLNKKLTNPPKFAIANGLYIGTLPDDFKDSTFTENAMLNLAQPMHFITVVRGGKQSSLRSHAYFFRADPAPPANMLPCNVAADGIIGVSMVGAMTPAQKAVTMKKYDVRVERIKEQLAWYKKQNRLFSRVLERPDWEISTALCSTKVVVDNTHVCEPPASEGCNKSDGDQGLEWNEGRERMRRAVPSLEVTTAAESLLSAGVDELDGATWRHNAPAPASHSVTADDEECEVVSSGLISDFNQIDALDGIHHALHKTPVTVYRSSDILSDFDPAFWSYAFCELFPYGRGGLDEPRAIRISLTEYIRYCMRLASRKHAQHRSFSLVSFDVLARHSMLQAISIRAKMAPVTMENAAGVPREALLRFVQYQQQRREAIRQQRPIPDAPQLDTRINDLCSGISVGMRAFWGSNEEKASARADLFAMQIALGQPTIFFTISPDCSTTYQVANLAGLNCPNVLSAMNDAVEECITYSRARLGQIATANPYECARYFDCLMKVFFEVVLNWDTKAGCARAEPGLFGWTKAYFASTESQSSTGSLHSHMLIWIDRMPTTVQDYYTMCHSERFRSTLVQYVDSLVSSSVPIEMTACPMCGGRIASIGLRRDAFHRPKKCEKRVETTRCNACGAAFGGSELIDRHVERLERELDGNVTPEEMTHYIASPKPLPQVLCPSTLPAIISSRALLIYQHHHWFHSKSCFKVTKRTPKGNVCRMFMPKEPCAETRWIENNTRIELARDPGNEYINAYSPVINAIFKCNHDIKFLGAGEGPDKGYYIIKYSTKPQIDLENPWALHLHALDKADSRIEETDPISAGRRRVQSMCCSLSNPHEVSAPMACLYLLNGSSVYSSHAFVRLNLKDILQALYKGNEDIEVRLEGDNASGCLKPSTTWIDYISRPETLSNLCLADFVAEWVRKKGTRGLKLLEIHPLHNSHSLVRRPTRHIVTLAHKRLPDTRRTNLSDDETLRYQQTVMALYRPFRRVGHFTAPENVPFDRVFQLWWEHAPVAAKLYLKHSDDYYAARDYSKTSKDPDVARYLAYDDCGDSIGECIVSASLEDWGESEEDDCDTGSVDPPNDYTEIVCAPMQPSQHINMLEKSFDGAKLAAQSVLGGDITETLPYLTVDDVDKLALGVNHDDALVVNANEPYRPFKEWPDIQTRVELLENALQAENCGDEATTASLANSHLGLPQLPSLQTVSAAFGLNEKQQAMFTLIGKKLLRSILIGDIQDHQLIGFLGGLPGAGKSRVIAAVQALAEAWNHPESVATAAYQGVAAQAANGQTIHKLFGWRVSGSQQWTPTHEQKEKFAILRLLILDEISTCDVKILGMVDASLRKLTGRHKPFGGIHILLVGDWLQQLPVAGLPAYAGAKNMLDPRRDSREYLARMRGVEAYRHINAVVMLNENMRHRDDPVWRDILARWRVGHYIQSDIDLVNKIAYEENWLARRSSLKGYCPIIVTSNTLRVEFNTASLEAFAIASNAPIHRFPSVVKRFGSEVKGSLRKTLECIREDKTANMPMVLQFVINSPVQCTKNVSVPLKLANGTIGHVVGFQPSANDTVQEHTAEGAIQYLHSHPPEVVYIRLKDYPTHSFDSALPLGVVPIRARVEKSVKIKLPNRDFTISIAQIPLVPAFSLTTEKCQGLTVEKMILAPLRHPSRRIPQRSSFYVAVTRVKTLSQLYLMAPITSHYLEYFTPRRDAIEESNRLEAMEVAAAAAE